MSQLLPPSAALSQAFVLPKLEAEPSTAVAAPNRPSEDFFGYGFTLESLGFLLPATAPSALVGLETPVCRLPTAPACLLGMMNLGGNAVPLFDLEAILGLSAKRAATHYLVIGETDDAAAVRVSERPVLLRLDAEQRMTRSHPLPTALQPHARATYRDTHRVWVEWDVRAFFSAAAAGH